MQAILKLDQIDESKIYYTRNLVGGASRIDYKNEYMLVLYSDPMNIRNNLTE